MQLFIFFSLSLSRSFLFTRSILDNGLSFGTNNGWEKPLEWKHDNMKPPHWFIPPSRFSMLGNLQVANQCYGCVCVCLCCVCLPTVIQSTSTENKMEKKRETKSKPSIDNGNNNKTVLLTCDCLKIEKCIRRWAWKKKFVVWFFFAIVCVWAVRGQVCFVVFAAAALCVGMAVWRQGARLFRFLFGMQRI